MRLYSGAYYRLKCGCLCAGVGGGACAPWPEKDFCSIGVPGGWTHNGDMDNRPGSSRLDNCFTLNKFK
jgi:hypothetical protein